MQQNIAHIAFASKSHGQRCNGSFGPVDSKSRMQGMWIHPSILESAVRPLVARRVDVYHHIAVSNRQAAHVM